MATPADAAPRDRVLDLVKTSALMVVVVAHSLAWDLTTGEPESVLRVRPGLGVLTWLFQLLPLFFAAGAVTNLSCWRRYRGARPFQRHRLIRLATPGVVYALVWTTLCLPAAALTEEAEAAGRFLAQLTWFLGIYSLVVVAVPLTARWVTRPWLTLGLGLALIAAVDLLRWQVAEDLGWVNFVLVWGWLHQLGYHLPGLRRVARTRLVVVAALSLGAAVALAVFGPYSTAMVSVQGDDKMSNLSPPTLVLALVGLAQVLVLAAAWNVLDRFMERTWAWHAVAAVGSRSIGIYLWHIPLVGLVIVGVWISGWQGEALSAGWWFLHLLGLAVVLPGAWLIAGFSARVDALVQRHGARLTPIVGMAVVAVALPLVILNGSVTGFGTWWGSGLLGVPSSSLLNAVLLVVCLRVLLPSRSVARV